MEYKLVITSISNVTILGSCERLRDYPYHNIEQKNDYKPLLFACEQGSKRVGIIVNLQVRNANDENVPYGAGIPINMFVYYDNAMDQPLHGPLEVLPDCDQHIKEDGSARMHFRLVELSSLKRHDKRDFVVYISAASNNIYPVCCYPIRVVSKITKTTKLETPQRRSRPKSPTPARKKAKLQSTVAVKKLEEQVRTLKDSIDLMYLKMSNTTAEISQIAYANSILESEICSVQSVFT